MHFLIVLMFIAFFSATYQAFSIGNYGVTFVDLISVLLYLIAAKKVIWNADNLKIAIHPALFFFYGLLITVLLSGFTPLLEGSPAMITQYLKTMIHYIFLGFFAFIASSYKIEDRVWSNVIRSWIIMSVLINLFGIYQIFARAFELPLAWLDMTNVSLGGREGANVSDIKQLSLQYGNFFRATSIFSEPSSLASFNMVVIAFLAAPYIQGFKPFIKSKAFSIFAFALSAITMFITFSMTGVIGLLMLIAGIFLFERIKKIGSFVAVFVIGIVVILLTDGIIKDNLGISVVSLFEKRIGGLVGSREKSAGESVGSRLTSGKKGMQIWEDNPIIGSGLGLTAYNKKVKLNFTDFSVVSVFAETGTIGGIAFIGFFVALLLTTVGFIRKREKYAQLSAEKRRLLGVLFYMMLHQVLINFISGNNFVTIWLWLPIALILGVINSALIEMKAKTIVISLFGRSMKKEFGQAIGKYLDSEKK